ncbi:hypothetical protein H1R20_g9201, partial [Candolleomyces eurysporus]
MASEIPAHEIVVTRSPEERQQCYDVRINVFHHEQHFPLETEIDESVPAPPFLPPDHNVPFLNRHEDTATHFLLRLVPSLTPVGTIRLHQVKSPSGDYYKLTRLAILKEYRKYRFGRELVESLHEWVKAHALETNPVTIVCHSQLPVQGFYAKLGYLPEGEQFDEEGDPHQKMVLRLPL